MKSENLHRIRAERYIHSEPYFLLYNKANTSKALTHAIDRLLMTVFSVEVVRRGKIHRGTVANHE